MKRFLRFIQQIENSPKLLPNQLLRTIRNDCRSTTGSNLRNILLLTKKHDSTMLVPSDVLEIDYLPVPEEDKWKIPLIHSLLAVKAEEFEIIFDEEEDIPGNVVGDEILVNICCS